MLNHSSATARKGTRQANSEQRTANSQAKNKTRNLNVANSKQQTAISDDLRRRAEAIIKDRSIDAQSRAIMRYALVTNDAWLAELVRRADAGETIIYTVNSLKHPHSGKRIQGKRRLKH